MKFCSCCGTARTRQHTAADAVRWYQLQHAALFFLMELLCCIFALVVQQWTLTIMVAVTIVMATSSVLFFKSDWQQSKYLLRWPSFSWLKLLMFVGLAIVSSILVGISTDYLNSHLFKATMDYGNIYKPYSYGNCLMVLLMAVCPAVFEELAYRGYLIQKLSAVVDQKEAMYISSILFFLVHFSIASFYWMLPFALILGYIRIKENTLWYGILIHFFFNLTVCVSEIWNINFSELFS
ncbi:CPBP family intramembrane glutamic endopeptidase [Pedobacter sp. BAL39]|uniref:CPBP family intramembrane glutamic endopeptidase n=1 Tax=Pedobacter sp. BAL39 TaxID=391596 RepID=UPI000A075B23|nr:CPBP family intramembrane glutamic endopeptidase [Pedobacter sp. BAL39]